MNYIRDFVALAVTPNPPENINDHVMHNIVIPYFEALASQNWKGYGTYESWLMSKDVQEYLLNTYGFRSETDLRPLPGESSL